MIKPGASLHILSLGVALFTFESKCESLPSNVETGFLPPCTETSAQTLLFSVDANAAGTLILQRTSFDFSTSLEFPITLHDGSRFELDAPFGFGFYRLKSNGTPPPRELSIRGIQASTNRAFSFPVLAGWDPVVQVQDQRTKIWRNVPSKHTANGFLSCSPPSIIGPLRILARPPVQRESFEAIFVGGQSNALVSDNHYYPDKDTNVMYIDNELRFRHPAKFYDGLKDGWFAYSFANHGAGALSEHTGRKYLVVGVAVGGTPMSFWMPTENRFDRSTLFGRANFRRVAAAPQGVRVIWYYGHESSGGYPSAPNYIAEWKKLIGEFQMELGPVPVIFAQLAKSSRPAEHRAMFTAVEQQRLSEEGQAQGSPGHHMVVAFDLPLGDGLHLSGEANRILGLRFARAMRQHVYGEAVDGTGPRLVSVSLADAKQTTIRVTFTQVINQPVNAYDDQFRVTDSDGPLPIIAFSRSADGTSIDLKLREPAVGPLRLSYGEPASTANLLYLTNVVRNSEGLPAPAFGPLEVH